MLSKATKTANILFRECLPILKKFRTKPPEELLLDGNVVSEGNFVSIQLHGYTNSFLILSPDKIQHMVLIDGQKLANTREFPSDEIIDNLKKEKLDHVSLPDVQEYLHRPV